MSNQCFLDKFQLDNSKTLLIQGIPSTLEKFFAKLSFSKNVTPLLKRKKVDFALIFVINTDQLNKVLKDIFPTLSESSSLWVSYPKPTSKIVSDLNRNYDWAVLKDKGYLNVEEMELDNVWAAIHFSLPTAEEEKSEVVEDEDLTQSGRTFEKKLSVLPAELSTLFMTHKEAKEFFTSLPSRNQKEYLTWIKGAKKEEIKQQRLQLTLEKLLAGKTNPME